MSCSTANPFSIASVPTQVQDSTLPKTITQSSNSNSSQNSNALSPYSTFGSHRSNPFTDLQKTQSQNETEQLEMASISNNGPNLNGNDDGEKEDLARSLNNESRVSSNDKTLVFIIRVRDGWTKHLARHSENLITSQSQGEKVGMGSGKPNLRLRFLVDGPYSGSHVKDDYDSLILVAGE
jgi:hypothetical protein